MTASTAPVISTRGLSKSYRGVDALKGLDLEVPEHAIVGFLGPNGAGKSTAIKLLLGLARPTGGAGAVFGLDIASDSLAIRRRVGYLAQDPRFYDHLTARETLRFVARFFYAGRDAAIERRIAETLDLVGLADRADRPIKGFSGGERQRLGIAQAYVNHPELLILDEPAAALDPLGRRDVLQIMERLRGRTTIFYSTHILEDVQRVSDRVAILDGGALVAQAPVAALLAGGGATAYTIALRGETGAAHERVAAQPWVSAVAVVAQNGHAEWRVDVSDERAAEAQLLRLVLADGRVQVLDYGRRHRNLEQVFVDIVEGGNDGR
jgi:ABC-2 type transport system ATP-binding protein